MLGSQFLDIDDFAAPRCVVRTHRAATAARAQDRRPSNRPHPRVTNGDHRMKHRSTELWPARRCPARRTGVVLSFSARLSRSLAGRNQRAIVRRGGVSSRRPSRLFTECGDGSSGRTTGAADDQISLTCPICSGIAVFDESSRAHLLWRIAEPGDRWERTAGLVTILDRLDEEFIRRRDQLLSGGRRSFSRHCCFPADSVARISSCRGCARALTPTLSQREREPVWPDRTAMIDDELEPVTVTGRWVGFYRHRWEQLGTYPIIADWTVHGNEVGSVQRDGHQVQYSGTLDRETMCIEGEWIIRHRGLFGRFLPAQARGSFELYRKS